MADNEIFCTVKLDEDDWKAIERAIMTIEKRLERIEAILDARGLDWDHPRVEEDHFAGANKMVAEEPPKKWRILEPGEVVCSGDWVNAKSNLPHGLGWKLQTFSTGQTVSKHDECVFARPVADEPAKEAEPEYREPVLPGDAGKVCEFSDDGESWVKGYLKGFDCDRHWNEGTGWLRAQNFSADRARHRHCRIKKDA